METVLICKICSEVTINTTNITTEKINGFQKNSGAVDFVKFWNYELGLSHFDAFIIEFEYHICFIIICFINLQKKKKITRICFSTNLNKDHKLVKYFYLAKFFHKNLSRFSIFRDDTISFLLSILSLLSLYFFMHSLLLPVWLFGCFKKSCLSVNIGKNSSLRLRKLMKIEQ